MGILAGDFYKPDPAFTQRETRVYILHELQRWLTGRLCEDAKTVGDADIGTHMEDGTWPAARLNKVLRLLEKDNSYILPPNDKMDKFQFVGQWAVSVCTDYLMGYNPGIPAAILATGFVADDTLPCGRTIQSFWNHTPFDPLREAAPLNEGVDEGQDEDLNEGQDEGVDEGLDEGVDEGLDEGVDEGIDESVTFVYKLLTSRVTVPSWAFPAWIVIAVVGGAAAYMAVIVAAISRCGRL
jgi:hypothetical protein